MALGICLVTYSQQGLRVFVCTKIKELINSFDYKENNSPGVEN